MSQGVASRQVPDAAEFRTLLKRLKRGDAPTDLELLPFLALESRADRSRVNLSLAKAYLARYERSGDADSLEKARACIERAAVLSRYGPEVLPSLIDIHQASDDSPAIKQDLKWAGIEAARCGNVDEALALFDRWARVEYRFSRVDQREFDLDVLACVERMSAFDRFRHPEIRQPHEGTRLRIAHLMHGLVEEGSVLAKIDRLFARHLDSSRFDVCYFTVDDEAAVGASPDAQETIAEIRESGWDVVPAPRTGSVYQSLVSLGSQIHDFGPDILVTSAGLATFRTLFVVCLRPAPVTISLHQGPSPQFTWHGFDHAISWFQSILIDCPVDCSCVPLELEWPEIRPEKGVRVSLGIPQGARIVASGGRWVKFQDPAYWEAMVRLLREHEDLYWLVVGMYEDRAPLAEIPRASQVGDRIRLVGWRDDYLELLAAADLFVDSYPVGGGVLTMEAMALRLPVISFEHDYVRIFDNTSGSGGPEIVEIPELLVPRGDFEHLVTVASRMLEDADYRHRMAQACFEQIHEKRSDPSRMVRRCEAIYERVYEANRLRHAQAAPGTGPASDLSDRQLDEQRGVLIEHAAALNRREAALARRAARWKVRPPVRVSRRLRLEWNRSNLRGKLREIARARLRGRLRDVARRF